MTIKTKLLVLIGCLIIALGIVAWRGLAGMQDINTALNEIDHNQFVPARTVANANSALIAWNRATLNHVLAENEAKMSEYEAVMTEQREAVEAKLQELSENEGLSEKGKGLVTEIQAGMSQAEEIRNRVVHESRSEAADRILEDKVEAARADLATARDTGSDAQVGAAQASLDAARQELEAHLQSKTESAGDEARSAKALLREELRPVVDELDADLGELLALQESQLESAMEATDQRVAAGLRNITLLSVAMAVAALAFGLLIVTGVTKGINRVVVAIKDIAEGDGDLTQRLPEEGNDELTALAQRFNQFASLVHDIVANAQDAASSVSAASDEVGSSANEAASGSQTLAETVTQMAQGSESQAQQIGEARDQIDSLRDAIDNVQQGAESLASNAEGTMQNAHNMAQAAAQVSELSAQVADGAGESSRTAEEGARAVGSSVEAMESIQQSAGESMELIRELGRQSEAIGEIVGVIEDVADQTNLLALNAAIEAARAGEHGKGFAVVAEEVRKLAERTAQSTGEITGLIKEIQSGISRTVEAQERATEQTNEGAQLIKGAGEALDGILRSVNQVVELITTVSQSSTQMSEGVDSVVKAIEEISAVSEENSAATEEMTAASEQVRGSINTIATVAEQNSAGAQEANAATEEQSAAAEEIAASAEELAASAQSLDDLVRQFRVDASAQAAVAAASAQEDAA
ncbi:MAG: HAMP domain-containing protein [Armatimonadia bacterium]|nr:HAMP domain-containing protein [Armatimonadia bacterium]